MSTKATTPTDMLRISVADGKYTLVQDASGKLFALRYGEPWRDLVGDGLVLALGYDLEEAREVLRDLFTLIDEGVLVRDTSHDNDAAHFMTQGMRLVKVLKRGQDVLKEAKMLPPPLPLVH